MTAQELIINHIKKKAIERHEKYQIEIPEDITDSDEYCSVKYDVRHEGQEVIINGKDIPSCRVFECVYHFQEIDGKCVAYPYWFGGGKHGEPESVDWIEYAFFIELDTPIVVQTYKEIK